MVQPSYVFPTKKFTMFSLSHTGYNFEDNFVIFDVQVTVHRDKFL